jgi:hypothetical protein
MVTSGFHTKVTYAFLISPTRTPSTFLANNLLVYTE